MDKLQTGLPPEVEEQWREWSRTDSAVDEAELRRNLLMRTESRGPRRHAPLAMALAAAGLVALLIGLESTRRQGVPISPTEAVWIHDTSDNVILVLREDKSPIYVVTEPNPDGEGERQ